MDEKKARLRHIVERAKSALIVLLLVSAGYLAIEAQLFVGMGSFLSSTTTITDDGELSHNIQSDAARPVRMAVILSEKNGRMYGMQYNQAGTDAMFLGASTLLKEALNSVGEPYKVSRTDWETALTTSPSIYFDLLGQVPLSVLSGWLSGKEDALMVGVARRIVLTVQDDQVVLLYQQGDGDAFYGCVVSAVDRAQLDAFVVGYFGNGAQFAFESEQLSEIDPYTMVLQESPRPNEYINTIPVKPDVNFNVLLDVLNFYEETNHIYEAPEGTKVRNGMDTLLITHDGEVRYEAQSGEASRYPVLNARRVPNAFDVVEVCREILNQTISRYCGEARLSLLSVTEENGKWLVRFGYTLNGIQVLMTDGGEAAEFVVSDTGIESFTLRFRNYMPTGERTMVLPEVQAAAAVEAMGESGSELMLAYHDSGAGLVQASWVVDGEK